MHIHALPTDLVRDLQIGGTDAHGNAPERAISSGSGTPCRHCMKNVPEGDEMLILAHRPFAELQPYAESGPIFLCAAPCVRGGGSSDLPPVLTNSPTYLVKAYDARERIIYGTGAITPSDQITTRAATLMEDPHVAFVDVRSAKNNCYLARITR